MKNFLRVFCLVFVTAFVIGGLFFTKSTVSAFLQEYDVKALENAKDRCTNQDQCLGMCQCSLEVDGGGLLGKQDYTWVVFNKQENKKLFRVSGRKGPLNTAWSFEAYFNFNEQGCSVTFTGDQEEVKNNVVTPFRGTSCRYFEPFCCCKPSGKELNDCQRNVTYDPDKNFIPVCAGLSDEYKPAKLTTKGMTCQELEQKSKVKPKEDPGYVSGIDPRAEAKILNKVSFSNLTGLIGQVVKVLLAFIGSISLALYVYAGILWMTASGESSRIEKSKEVIVWTTLGVAVMLGSYLIVNYLFGFLK